MVYVSCATSHRLAINSIESKYSKGKGKSKASVLGIAKQVPGALLQPWKWWLIGIGHSIAGFFRGAR